MNTLREDISSFSSTRVHIALQLCENSVLATIRGLNERKQGGGGGRKNDVF